MLKKLFNSGGDPAEMPFLDHLEELRWRVLWSLLAITVGSIIGWLVVNRFDVLELLIDPIRPYLDTCGKVAMSAAGAPAPVPVPGAATCVSDPRLAYLGPMDPFFITLRLAITIGFLLAFPIVVGQLWAFISPALHKREKRAIVPALYLGLVLFLAGVALAYFVVLPMTFKFASGFQNDSLRQQIVIGQYLSVVIKVLLAFGVVFEMPVVVLVLSALGLVTSKFLREKRRFAIAISAVTAAMLTPGDAITVTVFMMGPLIVLYETSIVLARLMERRRADSILGEMAEAS